MKGHENKYDWTYKEEDTYTLTIKNPTTEEEGTYNVTLAKLFNSLKFVPFFCPVDCEGAG